jgi:hypothetical protein
MSDSVNMLFNFMDEQCFKTGPFSPSNVFTESPESVRPNGSQPTAETLDILPEIDVSEKVAEQSSCDAVKKLQRASVAYWPLGFHKNQTFEQWFGRETDNHFFFWVLLDLKRFGICSRSWLQQGQWETLKINASNQTNANLA